MNNFHDEQRRCFQTKSVSSRQLTRVVTTHAYLATKRKDKKKTRKEKENQRRRNPYARTSLQDYFYAETTPTW